MSAAAIKLTTYLGERDRCADGSFVADRLVDLYAERCVEISLLVRGIEGFGLKHQLQTDRLLTLSEDLPLVSVAVDRRDRIEALVDAVATIQSTGLITLEHGLLLSGALADVPDQPSAMSKLTVYLGRHASLDGRPAYRAVVDELQRSGIAGATVLLGVDGTVHGRRERARFTSANRAVPLMIISVGDADRIAAVLPRLAPLLPDPLATLEPVTVCKRDGVTVAPLPSAPAATAPWQKLMVFTSEQTSHDGRPLYMALVRALREAGATGATTMRGLWGYHGDHAPAGDRLWSVRRRVPIVTVIVDRPAQIARWYAVVDALTSSGGLITSEFVPAVQASGTGQVVGDLRLAEG